MPKVTQWEVVELSFEVLPLLVVNYLSSVFVHFYKVRDVG